MTSGDNLTINSGAVVTCDRTPSVLIGQVNINDGKLLIDGVNIGAGNMINFVGEYLEEINANGRGTLEVDGDWYSVGTTDGTNSQTFNLATYYDSSFCVDVIPMIQVETGRRITFDNSSGTAPEVDDYVRKASDYTIMGRIIQAEATYLVVRYLTGTLINNDNIEVRKVVDDDGPDMQVSWTADVNHASGDIKETGVYQEFANAVANSVSHIADYHHGVGGFVFANIFQSTTLTMGSAAGATGGFVAPSGCDVRIPNVHFSTSNTTNYASNNTYHDGGTNEANRYQLSTGLGGEVDFSVCNLGSVWFGCTGAYSFVAEYTGGSIDWGSTVCATKPTYTHCILTLDTINLSTNIQGFAFRCADLSYGVDVIDCMMVISRTRGGFGADTCFGVKFTGCIVSSPAVTVASSSACYLYYILRSTGIIFNNNIAISADQAEVDQCFYSQTSSDFECNNFLMCCSQDETEQVTAKNAIQLSTVCDNFTFIGLEFLGSGTPGGYVFYLTDVTNIKIRCAGMVDDKISLGAGGNTVINMYGSCANIDTARMWFTAGSSKRFINIPTVTKNVTVTNCSGDYTGEFQPSGLDGISHKGLHAASGDPGSTTGIEDYYPISYGRQIHDGCRADTVGYIVCLMINPSNTIDNTTVTAGNPKFFKDGDLNMVSGDVIEFEMDYFTRGHISFPGTYTSTIGTSVWNANEWTNVTLDFQYDIGSGWSGTWLDVRTASNWTGITITAAAGVKLKFRFTATGTQNDMSMLIIDTVTSIAVQKANFYSIDQVECDVILNGIVVDSRYWIYDSDTSTELAEGTASADPVTETVTVPSSTNLLIRVRKSSASVKYEPFITTAVTNETEINVAIIQQVDDIAT